jgi:type II secretory pathway pseudopilin PulG
LEVILALAILAGAVAVLGEVARQGLETARIARDLTYAQFICDSLMAEVTSGIVYPESVDQVPVDQVSDPSQMGWVYSIDVESTEIEGLVAVRVTVAQPLPEEKHPVRCSLVRWMQDPNMTFATTGTQ